jgi:hypothetical protein
MRKHLLWLICLLSLVLAACEAFTPPPTNTPIPTRGISGPTIEPSPVVRGEVPTAEAAAFIGQNDPTAAAAPSDGDLPPIAVGTLIPGEVRQTIQLPATDGTLLNGTLYSSGAERVPGVLMLAPDSATWLDLPLRLQAAGFTVLSMNLGDVRSQDDFTVILRSLSDVGTVDPAGIGVVGAEGGADLALTGCAADLLCDAVALISPSPNDSLILTVQQFNPRPVFLAAGQADVDTFATVGELNRFASEAMLESGAGAERGALLVQANPGIGDRLIEWLRNQL